MSLALSLAFSFLATAETAPKTSPPPPTAEQGTITVTGTKPSPEDVICEKVPQLGSRLVTKRVCATRSQWAQRQQDDKAYVNDVYRNSLLWNSPPH